MGILIVAALAAPAQEDAAKVLREALDKWARADGIRFRGRVSEDVPFEGVGLRLPGLDVGARGILSGSVDGLGAARIRVEAADGVEEIYSRKGRVVRKRVWVGSSEVSEALPYELLSLLRPSVFRKAERVRLEGDAEREGIRLWKIRADLPPSAVAEGRPAKGDPDVAFRMFVRRKIEATFYIRKGGRELWGMEVVLTRGFASQALPGVKPAEKATPKAFDELLGKNFRRTYAIEEIRSGKAAPLKIPDEIERFFRD